MNIQKYLLPATLAATVHVALFWLMPEKPYTRITEVAVKPAPPKPPDVMPVPQEEREHAVSTEPVKPLVGKPAPPELDDIPTKLPDGAFPMPVDIRPRRFADQISSIPTTIGDEIGAPDGIDVSRMAVFSPGDLDRLPNAKVQLPPDYPAALRQAGVSGSVLVEFDVDAEGRVVRAEAVRCTHREFAEPAVRAVRKWRFEPGRRNGHAVPFRMTVPIEFGIGNN